MQALSIMMAIIMMTIIANAIEVHMLRKLLRRFMTDIRSYLR